MGLDRGHFPVARAISKINELTQVMKVQGRCRKDMGLLWYEYWGFLISNVIRGRA